MAPEAPVLGSLSPWGPPPRPHTKPTGICESFVGPAESDTEGPEGQTPCDCLQTGYPESSESQRQKVGRYTLGARESGHRRGASMAALSPGRLRRFWRCWWLPCTQGEHVQCHPACVLGSIPSSVAFVGAGTSFSRNGWRVPESGAARDPGGGGRGWGVLQVGWGVLRGLRVGEAMSRALSRHTSQQLCSVSTTDCMQDFTPGKGSPARGKYKDH